MDAYDYRIPGPDGKVYALRVYSGCDGCDAPAGLDISLVDPECDDIDYFDLDRLTELPVKEIPTVGVAVVHADHLWKELIREGLITEDAIEGEGPPWGALRQAVSDTHARYSKMMKKASPKKKRLAKARGR